MQPIPFQRVAIHDSFWEPRQQTNRTITLPHLFQELERAGNIPNLRLAAEGKREGYQGPVYMDSDLYKAMEAAAYVLAQYPDDPIREKLDEVIGILERAQTPEGYLNSYFQVVAPDKRWANLRDWHELYCAGHLFEAAVAHYEATGSDRLLKVATRYADYIDSVFGDAPGKRLGYCGHPEIELALIKLARITGEKRYRDLARFFLINRGRKIFAQEHGIDPDQYDGTIWQDNLPLTEHKEIVGHAVRAAYLFAGATDLLMEGDPQEEAIREMLLRVWRNTINRRTYITGGIGNEARHEGFTTDYALPNRTAYQETCASIALIFWAHRMGMLFGEAHYFDALERALYNGALAGISLSGNRFFYVNPLESDGTHHRQPWYNCACCPPNIARLLASLGGYLYGYAGDALWINLYAESTATVPLTGGEVRFEVRTNYPWDGKVELRFLDGTPYAITLHLRIPSWSPKPDLMLNGRPVPVQEEKGYAVFRHRWSGDDRLLLNLPMAPVLMEAHPLVEADRWQVALQRGPIVYCLEECDQPVPLERLALASDGRLTARHDEGFLGGMTLIEGEGVALADPESWGDTLYRPLRPRERVKVRAIPYYAWDNRSACPMRVWMPLV